MLQRFDEPFEVDLRTNRQAHPFEYPPHAVGFVLRRGSQVGRQAGDHDRADRDRFAVQEFVAALFDGVGKRMSEVQLASFAAFAFVAFDDVGFDADGPRDSFVQQRLVVAECVDRMVFEQFEQAPVGDQARFDDLGQPGPELAVGQRLQHRQVAQYEIGLIERADHIFVSFVVDSVFAPDAGVHLGQQRRSDESEP